MARTALAVQSIPANSGGAVTVVGADAANGMKFPNDGKAELMIVNTSGSAITLTAHSVPCSHGRSADLVLSCPDASTISVIPKLDPDLFNQASGADLGMVYIDFSAGVSVSVGVVHRS